MRLMPYEVASIKQRKEIPQNSCLIVIGYIEFLVMLLSDRVWMGYTRYSNQIFHALYR